MIQMYIYRCTVETLYSTIYYSKYFIELNMISLHNMLPFELTKDTPYLALSGELWSVFYEYFNRNWSCYKGFLLYVVAAYGLHKNWDLSWCQLRHHWSQQRLSLWQPNVPPVMIMLASWWLTIFSVWSCINTWEPSHMWVTGNDSLTPYAKK